MGYTFKKIDLTPQQKIWLKAVVEAFLKGNKVSTADLKIDLRQELGSGFDPTKINSRLLESDGITPTLLGLWHVDPNHHLIELCDQVIRFIKDEVLPSKVKSVSAKELANRLRGTEREIRLVFLLMDSIGTFWNGTAGIPPNGVGYQEIRFSSDSVINTYLSYKGLEDAIAEKERRRHEEKIRLKKQRADAAAILSAGDVYGSLNGHLVYVNAQRLSELKNLQSQDFDLTRLVRLIEELNIAFAQGCWMSVAMLVRAIVDHVPPIFGVKTFSEVVNNYSWNSSHKREMERLDKSLRNVADAHLHLQIRNKEVLPNQTQVDFKAPLDVLLSEIIRILK